MSRWIATGIVSLVLVSSFSVSDVEARGRRSTYCPNCQYSMPTVTLPAAQAPAPPAEDTANVAEESEAPVIANSGPSLYTNYGSTRRVRLFTRNRR